jgi:hypothetical protein
LQHIRSITLQLPFQFTPHSHLNHGRGKFNPATSGCAVVGLANCIPFAVPKDWTYTGSVVDVCRALGKYVNVSIVNLVCPGWYEPDSVGEKVTQTKRIEKPRDANSQGMKIQVVRVSRTQRSRDNLSTLEARQWSLMHECNGKGWETKQTRCDEFGRLHIKAD